MFGLIANTALIANLLMLIGILTILEPLITWNSWHYTTVGMAVDANVLIFERIRELKEKSPIHALTRDILGKITVLDVNITTLLLLLFYSLLARVQLKVLLLLRDWNYYNTFYSIL